MLIRGSLYSLIKPVPMLRLSIYLSRNPEGRWGTIFCLLNYCFPLFAVMRRPLRVCQRQPGPLLDIIFPSSFLSTSLSSTLHSTLQGDFCQACWPCHMPIPSQFFASNCAEQIFMRANDICYFFSDSFVWDSIFVGDVQNFTEASHFKGPDSPLEFCCERPRFAAIHKNCHCKRAHKSDLWVKGNFLASPDVP